MNVEIGEGAGRGVGYGRDWGRVSLHPIIDETIGNIRKEPWTIDGCECDVLETTIYLPSAFVPWVRQEEILVNKRRTVQLWGI